MNKKNLVEVVAEMNRIIATTTKENATKNVDRFFEHVNYLQSNLGEVHFMRKRGRFLWFFVKEETEEKCLNFLRTIRNIKEKRRKADQLNDFYIIKNCENQLNLDWLW